MAGDKNAAYTVVAPLVIAKTETGDRYLYEGATVPADVDAAEVERLLEGGFIREGELVADQPKADEAPVKSWNHAQIDDWAAKQSPAIEFVNPDPTKDLTKEQKLEQIAAAVASRSGS